MLVVVALTMARAGCCPDHPRWLPMLSTRPEVSDAGVDGAGASGRPRRPGGASLFPK